MKKKTIIFAVAVSIVIGSPVGVFASSPDFPSLDQNNEISILSDSESVQTYSDTSANTQENSNETFDNEDQFDELSKETDTSITQSNLSQTDSECDDTLTQYIDAEGNKFLIASNGTHYTGWYNMQPYGDLYYDPENNGAAIQNCIAEIDQKSYYFDSNGIAMKSTGTPVINNKKYWIKSDGSLGTGWLYLGKFKLYFDPETYTALTINNGITDIDGKKYLFNKDGVMQNYAGTTVVNGTKYWFSTDDSSLKAGWLNLESWTLYFDPETYGDVTGINEIDGRKYLFDSNGILQTTGTPTVAGKKYFIGADNTLQFGWIKLGKWKMYFNYETGTAAVGITRIDGKDYLFNHDGVVQDYAGTTIVNGKKYWFSTDNASLKSGWLNLGNAKLYFDPTTYAAYTSTTATIDGIEYEFDSNGCARQCLKGKTNAEKIFNFLIDSGWTKQAAAGAVGNMYQESGCGNDINPSSYASGRWGEGGGIAGFTDNGVSTEFSKLKNYAKSKNKDWTDLQIQCEFLIYQLSHGSWYGQYSTPTYRQMLNRGYGITNMSYQEFIGLTDVELTTKAFLCFYEDCGMTSAHYEDVRLPMAQLTYNLLR